ncbi:U32 family peptidase [Persicobacter diffluens]|uniref:Peptidase U32 n=1 Tax=Persicobacter diffluens TaxID=981 RepID=A0AAN5AL67_9BACT|nr:peptidase U32 [Persicobacter diffluens]
MGRKVELLAPAKNIEVGKAAIRHGADAVYIGADQFGARAAVGNSVADIEQLVKYAHQYHAQIFVTMNTILYDEELEAARQQAWRLYEAGVDALIIQDMGMLEMDLPPLPLHASTQTHNYELSKIQFLEQVGLQRVVLARELSLMQMEEIRKNTNVELEYFVAGALCVCLSGQCYMSNAIGKRSANRGACGQPCRLPYDLVDANGMRIAEQKHLLSLKDLNLSDHVEDLVLAGVDSLKIEGRLKDETYVKNVVGNFRKKLDAVLDKHGDLDPLSHGKVSTSFEPDPERTFNRGYSTYFFEGRKQESIINEATPKAMGKKMGKVSEIRKKRVKITSDLPFHNGDGLCFISEKGQLGGMKVEVVEGDGWLTLSNTHDLQVGMEIFRNHDQEFTKQLNGDKTQRKIGAELQVSFSNGAINLCLKDDYGYQVTARHAFEWEAAKNVQRAKANLEKSLKKSGDSIFDIQQVILPEEIPFLPNGQVNAWRRDLLEALTEARVQAHQRPVVEFSPNETPFPSKKLDHHGNVTNQLARQFYERHGVQNIEEGFEVRADKENLRLMTTRHCLQYQIGMCHIHENFTKAPEGVKFPLFLEQGENRFRLRFDCKNCVMKIEKA